MAAVLGAFHALTPGHGKTIVGAYLVGTRGTWRHAVFLGLVVTATHTAGVYALGAVTLVASAWILPERLLPWLSAVSGLLVLGVGASLVRQRLEHAMHGHTHAHGDHVHHHHGPHEQHSHVPPADMTPTLVNLVALGVSGGLLPCPSALVVMLGAIALGRTAFGLALILAFSVGLAAVLTAIGLVLVHARRLFDRLPLDGRFARFAPVRERRHHLAGGARPGGGRAPADRRMTIGGILGLGFVLGLRHALDVDHLAAVSTIVSQRRSLWRSALVGAVWGVGHTTSLLAVAIGVIALHTEIPPFVGQLLELGVAVMLVGLGLRLLHTVLRGGALHAHVHDHAGRPHVHPHIHAHDVVDHDHGPRHRRPFLIGLVHGLAGSGGLMLAVAATIADPLVAIAYVVVFGVGSIGGMAATSTLFAIPMLATTTRFAGADRWLRTAAAIASVGVGVQLAWTIGHEAGLLT